MDEREMFVTPMKRWSCEHGSYCLSVIEAKFPMLRNTLR